MEIPKKIMDKLLEYLPGGFYGLLSVAIYIFCDIMAILFFPGSYNFLENMISDLGVGPGGIFFNLGLIISGIISIPFYMHLGRSLRSENIRSEILRKIAIVASLISIITYILIGFFPAIPENQIIFFIHGTLALISWVTGSIYCSFFSILMLKDVKFSKLQAYLGFIVSGIFILFLFTWWPLTEWLLTFAIIFWIIVNASYMLYHKI